MKKRAATGMVFLCILAMAGLAACRSDEQLPGTAEEIINTVCSRLGRAGELDADLSVDMDMDATAPTARTVLSTESISGAVVICVSVRAAKLRTFPETGNTHKYPK